MRTNIDGEPVVIDRPSLVICIPVDGTPTFMVAGATVAGQRAVIRRVAVDLEVHGQDLVDTVEAVLLDALESAVERIEERGGRRG